MNTKILVEYVFAFSCLDKTVGLRVLYVCLKTEHMQEYEELGLC